MKQKISILLLLCVAILLPSIATAQEFSIFAKQKVVVADIRDVNDRHLSEGIKKVIRDGIVDACTKSEDYEVYEVNIDDIMRQIATKGQTPTFSNICRGIGAKADYIIFTNVKLSSSEVGAQNITIYITSSLYRIATGSEMKTSVAEALPNSESIMSATTRLVAELLGLKSGSAAQQMAESSTPQNKTENPSAEQAYNKGLELYNRKNYSESIKFFDTAAKLGHTAAQYYLGNCYYYGRGVAQDYSNAVLWYYKAAEQGNVKAQNLLGICYAKGHGVTQSDTEATNWFRRAAERGYKVAQYNLGYNYKKGKGVPQDLYEAARWFRKAAEQGDEKAQNMLGNSYRKGEGVAQDYKTAIYWYELSASNNNPTALYNLGLCYEKGIGVICNRNKAKKYYEKAAEKGHKGAKKKLQNF